MDKHLQESLNQLQLEACNLLEVPILELRVGLDLTFTKGWKCQAEIYRKYTGWYVIAETDLFDTYLKAIDEMKEKLVELKNKEHFTQ